jgi:hypothetical protein
MGAPALLAVITACGLAFRAPGLTRGDLNYDDAWFALPARVGLTKALAMTGVAPGAMLLQRSWTLLNPSPTWFAQLLPLFMGSIAAPLLYLLGRTLGRSRWAALLMAAMVAVAPAAIEYSVRLREDSLDLVLAALLLLLAEQVRRRATWPWVVALAVASVAATAMAVELAAVAGGCLLALVVLALLERRRRGLVVGAAALTAVALGVVVHAIAATVPASFTATWRRSHVLVGQLSSTHDVRLAVATAAAGLGHGLVGTPIPTPETLTMDVVQGHALFWSLVLATLELVVLVAALVPVVRSLVDERRAVDRRLLAPAMVLLVAMVLFVAGVYPLGTGETDLLWFPAIIALVAALVDRVARWLSPRLPSIRARQVVAVGLAGVVGLGAARFAWHVRAWYPNQDVTALMKVLDGRLHPGDAIVVDQRTTMTWAYAGLSTFHVHTDRTAPAAGPPGFVVTLDPPLVLAEVWVPHAAGSGRVSTAAAVRSVPGLADLPTTTRRLVEIGQTGWAVDPWDARRWGSTGRLPVPSSTDVALRHAGWVATRWVNEATGVFSRVWVRPVALAVTDHGTRH